MKEGDQMTQNMKQRHQTGSRCGTRKPASAAFTCLGLLCATMAFISIVTSGCVDMKFRVGTRPDPSVLEKDLNVGKSTSEEVIRALGRPDGKGAALFTMYSQPSQLWSYYYEEGSTQEARRIFLFIFMNDDRYDGYMWFSSLQGSGTEKPK